MTPASTMPGQHASLAIALLLSLVVVAASSSSSSTAAAFSSSLPCSYRSSSHRVHLPPSSPPTTTTRRRSGGPNDDALLPSSSALFTNKKRPPPPNRSNGSKGFESGGASSTSPSSAGGAALVRPKTSPDFRYAGSIRPGMQTPMRTVPSGAAGVSFPDYALDGVPKARPALFPWVIEAKRADEIEKMRRAGRVAREVLDMAGRAVGPGITT